MKIQTLGKFEVRVNDEPIQFSRKLPRKSLMLLKALIACGGVDVPEQMLCDLLWGDEDGDAAVNALAITIVRLRKLLGVNEAILHHGGKISLNPQLCWTDALAFEARLSEEGNRNLLELYGGTFLPEDTGESWSVATRERLRGKFIHALSAYGTALEQEGDLDDAAKCYLRGIDADPIVEVFHQGLMRCLDRLGRRTEAISAYRRMKQTLSVVLGVPPSDASQKFYQNLLQKQIEDGADFEADTYASRTASVTILPARRARKSRRQQ